MSDFSELHYAVRESRIREIVRDEMRNALVFYKDASGAICDVKVKEEEDGQNICTSPSETS